MICALARYTPCPKEGRENGANCAEFAWLYLTQNELCETRVICGSLGSLPGPEKVPLFVRIARNLHHSQMLSANGMKFAQFASNLFLLFVYKRLLKQQSSLKMNRLSSVMIIAI